MKLFEWNQSEVFFFMKSKALWDIHKDNKPISFLVSVLPIAVAVAAWVVGAVVGVVYTNVTGACVATPT
jgi:hypothetical protein